ncbi:hypothetical protein [Hyphomicrobium sp. DY-1]|uniref:hypothetical protein n=1 Tax=Hyphomicrobium sp. DY-1 TaxID=3075650 RepID=UPI0039C3B6F8
MIYFVERADGRIKIGFVHSLYNVDPDFHGGRLIGLVEGSTTRLASIRKLFSEVPKEDGCYLMTSGLFLFLKDNSIENSADPRARALWAEIMNKGDNGGYDSRTRKFDQDNIGWHSGGLKRRSKFRQPFFDQDD